MKTTMGFAVAAAILAGGPCEGPTALPLPHEQVVGTWGGENAGLIADDSTAHVHIGCTFGNIPHGIVAVSGAFVVPGEYLLRAYPVAVGPMLPAQFQGRVSGKTLTLTVIVTDTTADTTATLGPVRLYYGREPQMGPCPICRSPRGAPMSPR